MMNRALGRRPLALAAVFGAVFGAVVLTGCSPVADDASSPSRVADEAISDPVPTAPSDPVDDGRPRVVFLGDSLTAGYGLDEPEAFPAVVDRALRREGTEVHMVNAGVSGDTTAGGLARLDWLLRQQPDLVVVALGGNDGLRGLDLAASEANLRAIIERVQASGAGVLLAGMQIPPNYGQEYTAAFAAIYPRLAAALDVPLIPFLLLGVGGDPELNQPDGIHPTAEGQRLIAETVMQHLRPLIEEMESNRERDSTMSMSSEAAGEAPSHL